MQAVMTVRPKFMDDPINEYRQVGYEVEWEGATCGFILTRSLRHIGVTQELRPYQTFNVGPYRVQLTVLDPSLRGWEFVIIHSPIDRIRAHLYRRIALFRVTRVELKARIIWTLEIWNLARCEPGTFPQWSDIRGPWHRRADK